MFVGKVPQASDIFRYSEKEKESGVVGSCSQRKKKLREGILDMHLPPVSVT